MLYTFLHFKFSNFHLHVGLKVNYLFQVKLDEIGAMVCNFAFYSDQSEFESRRSLQFSFCKIV